MTTIAAAAAATIANGGATFAADGTPVTEGFAVAGIAEAIRIDVADFTAELLAEVITLFAEAGTFGTWIEDGEVWIEPSEVYTDRAEAERVARQRDEIAFYDLTAGQEIRLR
ncbi:hypothetical protein SEA_IAMGROOT_69 [Microbacterium phage IAmGroot]|uniref:Uncharacterized protein n=1 Tax=Microbacterium phage IAmGroot TaxID=2588486 RepID=A0A4Y6E746_9CAUD|nr:hypothetical protein SEA_IAMGROOT_69 [Microbacterium phage IAmGroot]